MCFWLLIKNFPVPKVTYMNVSFCSKKQIHSNEEAVTRERVAFLTISAWQVTAAINHFLVID